MDLYIQKYKIILFIAFLACEVSGFWDQGTTTVRGVRTDTTPRQSFFRWQWIEALTMKFWFWHYDWVEINNRFRLVRIAGLSIDQTPLTTGALLNRRSVVTACNPVAPFMHRQKELRIWALGRSGKHHTPYRYRVYSVLRLVPPSLNPEHCHGPRCYHQPRNDVCVIHSMDQIYMFPYPPHRYLYPYRVTIVQKYQRITDQGWIWMAGSGYEYLEHIYENYKIFYYEFAFSHIVDCSKYTVKTWGKFICIRNVKAFPGVQNGGPLIAHNGYLMGVGCFEIRYNEDRIFAFTDMRYYLSKLYHYAHLWPGAYYEYAYPQWGAYMFGSLYDGDFNIPYIPQWQVMPDAVYPMGRK